MNLGGGKGHTQSWDEEQKKESFDEYLAKISLPQAREILEKYRMRLAEHVWTLRWAPFPSLCGMWFFSRIRWIVLVFTRRDSTLSPHRYASRISPMPTN